MTQMRVPRFTFAPTGGRRRTLAAVAAMLVLAAQPGTAVAAAPANDVPAGAVAITSIPSSISQDTTEATVTTDDIGCGAGGEDQATVWYTLTLPDAATVAIDAAGSSYGVGINVYAGTASADNLIACSTPAVVVEADAGSTFYLMFADIDGGENGGQLEVTLDLAPPPIEVNLTVDGTGKVNPKTGEAIVGGTMTCSSATTDAFVEVQLTQSVGRFTIHGFWGVDLECGPAPTQWWAAISGDNGRFGGGKATVTASAFACDTFSCGDANAVASVRLRK